MWGIREATSSTREARAVFGSGRWLGKLERVTAARRTALAAIAGIITKPLTNRMMRRRKTVKPCTRSPRTSTKTRNRPERDRTPKHPKINPTPNASPTSARRSLWWKRIKRRRRWAPSSWPSSSPGRRTTSWSWWTRSVTSASPRRCGLWDTGCATSTAPSTPCVTRSATRPSAPPSDPSYCVRRTNPTSLRSSRDGPRTLTGDTRGTLSVASDAQCLY